jgi:hypothetical protein
MAIYTMSSNAFLQPIRLISMPQPKRVGVSLSWRRTELLFAGSGDCFLRSDGGLEWVAVLRDRCIWLRHLAGLSVRDANQRVAVLWFLRWEQRPEGWRRARVRFFHP